MAKGTYGTYHRSYYEQNPERIKAASQKRRAEKPDAVENARLKRMFGITLEDYNRMLERQGGVCAICGKPERQSWRKGRAPKKLTVDHDHETGQVRQLLCQKCNSILGYAEDSVLTLLEAVSYLRRHRGGQS